MTDTSRAQIHTCVVAVTDLEPNGVPKPGANHRYVTDAVTTISLKPVYKDGSSIEDESGCGELVVAYEGEPSYKWDEVEIEFLKRMPLLEAMLSGGVALTLGGGVPLGYAGPAIGAVRTHGVSIEFFAKRIVGGDLDPEFPYAWWALPKVRNLRRQDSEHGNSTSKPKFAGIAVENPNWFDGPTNDWPAASDRSVQWVPTTTLPDLTGATSVAVS